MERHAEDGTLLPLVNDVDTHHGKEASDEVLHIEWLAKTKARGESTYYGDERVEDGDLTYGVAADKFVVEGKAKC